MEGSEIIIVDEKNQILPFGKKGELIAVFNSQLIIGKMRNKTRNHFFI